MEIYVVIEKDSDFIEGSKDKVRLTLEEATKFIGALRELSEGLNCGYED